MPKILSNQERRDLLEIVMPEYKPVSEAPNAVDWPLDKLDQELKRRYKTVDSYGNVYLIQNPSARRMRRDARGRIWVNQSPRKLAMESKQALRQVRSSDTGTRYEQWD